MRLHKEDFEILKVIGRGAFGEVRYLPPHPHPPSPLYYTTQLCSGPLLKLRTYNLLFPPFSFVAETGVLG